MSDIGNAKFNFGSLVTVDGYLDVEFIVIGVAFYRTNVSVQLSYFVNGALTEIWVDEARCTAVRRRDESQNESLVGENWNNWER